MANVKAFIRTTKKKSQLVNIRFRLIDGRGVQIFHTSDMKVREEYWDGDKEQIKARVVYDHDERYKLNSLVAARKQLILEVYASCTEDATSTWLNDEIEKRLHQNQFHNLGEDAFFSSFLRFLAQSKMGSARKTHYMVVSRALQRFELFQRKARPSFILSFDTITSDSLRDIEKFLLDEPAVYAKYPDIYAKISECRQPVQRGQNTVSGMLSKIRTLFRWAIENGLAGTNPFNRFLITPPVYGTPFYITKEERDRVFMVNLSRHPYLSIQRDIFIFQCMIGCRVGDLIRMTGSSIVNEAVEYIARKTKDEHPETVRVPLNSTAQSILYRYPTIGSQPLLPFISPQKYNSALKRIFMAARLRRMVTVRNSKTGLDEKRPLYELGTSHISRRSFISILYNQGNDPGLIGKLTGHADGSKAFNRYRAIDEDTKINLVNTLE